MLFQARPICVVWRDCLYALQRSTPHLTRSALHRRLERYGFSRLPDVEGDKPKCRRFKRYPSDSTTWILPKCKPLKVTLSLRGKRPHQQGQSPCFYGGLAVEFTRPSSVSGRVSSRHCSCWGVRDCKTTATQWPSAGKSTKGGGLLADLEYDPECLREALQDKGIKLCIPGRCHMASPTSTTNAATGLRSCSEA